MLERVTHIEGLDAFEDHDLSDDTSPGAMICRFFVQAMEMPFLTAEKGEIVYQNKLLVERIWHLGAFRVVRPIKDTVVYDEEKAKWIVKKLAPGDLSDIRKNPNEWNAFNRNVKLSDPGVPLTLLFKNDPARAASYKKYGIESVEQLATLNHSDQQSIGRGVQQDVEAAKIYLDKMKKNAPSIELNSKLEEKDRQIISLQNQLADLSSKLTELLKADLETREVSAVKKPRGRPFKNPELTA